MKSEREADLCYGVGLPVAIDGSIFVELILDAFTSKRGYVNYTNIGISYGAIAHNFLY